MEEKPVNERVEKLVTRHVVYSMTAGAIPLPLVDIAAVTAIQLDMIRKIAEIHDADFDEDAGKSLIGSLAGATAAKIGASLVKSIPGIGTILGIGAQVILSGASTYALGELFDLHFSKKGTVFDLDVKEARQAYKEFFKKGRKVAENLQRGAGSEDVFKTIGKLDELRKTGALTEEEFQETKKRLLDKIVGEEK